MSLHSLFTLRQSRTACCIIPGSALDAVMRSAEENIVIVFYLPISPTICYYTDQGALLVLWRKYDRLTLGLLFSFLFHRMDYFSLLVTDYMRFNALGKNGLSLIDVASHPVYIYICNSQLFYLLGTRGFQPLISSASLSRRLSARAPLGAPLFLIGKPGGTSARGEEFFDSKPSTPRAGSAGFRPCSSAVR